ncbi:MAG: hypothetical protein NTY02_05565 [Acidobacteria bacterium]|nr:hypothetical protein [Acidobacteriota bacterium]
MTYRLRVTCICGAYLKEDCVRVLALDSGASLLDLHHCIQNAVSFDRDHPYEFYTANSGSPFAVRNWITMEDEWAEKVAAFGRTQLKDIWPMGRKKLYYWFDFGDRWIFEVRKMRAGQGDETLSTPGVIERIGPDPQQYPRAGS